MERKVNWISSYVIVAPIKISYYFKFEYEKYYFFIRKMYFYMFSFWPRDLFKISNLATEIMLSLKTMWKNSYDVNRRYITIILLLDGLIVKKGKSIGLFTGNRKLRWRLVCKNVFHFYFLFLFCEKSFIF